MNNYLSPSNNQTQKWPLRVALEIQALDWDRHKIVAVLNWLMGSQPSSMAHNEIIYMYVNEI
jgi:hypothetical protein